MGAGASLCCLSKAKERPVSGRPQSSTWRLFTFKELSAATNGFSVENQIGEGGFGIVYRGLLKDGRQIAVKKLKTINSKAEMEFAVEVEILGRVRHKNLLGLRGYCVGSNQRLIVYDYMPNLSLFSHLHGQHASEERLDWKKRINIIIKSAEALEYLHHSVTPHIIHRDIKASNVLLNSNFEPLVADFGFAKLLPEGVSHMTTRVKGTLGYLAPEYAMWGKVSEACDVYSFGILLLEIVSGHRPIERLPGGAKETVAEWADPLLAAGHLPDLVDARLRGVFDSRELARVVHAAARCVQAEPDQRPTMRQVLAVLKGTAAAADPIKNCKLEASLYSDEESSVFSTPSIGGGMCQGMMRIERVKYKEELLAMDDDGEGEAEFTRSESEEENVYGVFGAMAVRHSGYHGRQQTAGIVNNRQAFLRG
ncbi:hypothetical protein HPP92_020164 [Vanilla planifolia]|uniref:Protein kinase domain-containing protein n=1 Tax=Vanilla planifolia TaxID=51239 RepID=A0A835Q1K6_VANPL|nr:hypothetical protein HPP92_020610 [Vanilla planifolia]KAG0466000.1 hypothetical protein HPP92_020164 [Vanilla planifolia]